MVKFYNSKNEEKGKIESNGQSLYIYGDIVGDKWSKWMSEDTCPTDVKEFFESFDKSQPVDIFINSGGGSVWGALAICSLIGRYLGKTTAHIDGIAASAASVIACACDEIIMPEYAQMMIHKPWAGTYGNADELRKIADSLDSAEDSIVSIYMSKAAPGVTEETLRQKLSDETWLTGKNAFELFNVTVEAGAEPAAAATSDFYDRYEHRPKPEKSPENKETEKEKRQAAIIAAFEKYYK